MDHGELSREYWEKRALAAESKVKELEEKVAAQGDELLEIRAALRNSTNSKEGFAANADLAQVAVRETQALAAKAIIDGLKPQFNTLPKISQDIEALNSKLAGIPDMVKALESLPEMVKAFAGLPTMVTSLKDSMDKAVEHSVEADDARSSQAETLLCATNRVLKLLAHYGFSNDTKGFNVPATVNSIRDQLGRSAPPIGPSSSASLNRDLDWSSPDYSRPPPVLPAPGSFLLDQRNNNLPPRGGLMPNHAGFGYGSASCGHCPGNAHGSGYGMPPSSQHGHGHNKRPYPFGNNSGN